MSVFRKTIITAASAVSLVSLPWLATTAQAAEQTPAARKTSFAPSGVSTRKPSLEGIARGLPAGIDNALVFSAPPRETEEEGARIYQPIANYLSRVTGKTIVYRHPKDWLTYQTEMQRGSYDIVFDGPHFNSWRISRLGHTTLAKIAGEHAFAVVVHKDNSRVTDIKQLAGQKVCGMNPPNLGTLAVLSQFDNPMRQPLIMNSLGWERAYAGVAFEKKCTAAIIPVANLKNFSNHENVVRVIHKSKTLPNQAFSAGPRVDEQDKARMAAALVSPESQAALQRLLSASGAEQGLAYARKDEYAGLENYLKDSWGYAH